MLILEHKAKTGEEGREVMWTGNLENSVKHYEYAANVRTHAQNAGYSRISFTTKVLEIIDTTNQIQTAQYSVTNQLNIQMRI
jgi:hypothetical protein